MPVTIREAHPGDAANIITYVNELLEEPASFLEMSKGEFTVSVEEERKMLEDCRKSENSIFVVAEEEGQIIGLLICTGRDRIKIKHNTVLGMSVDKRYRNRGIGSKLLEYAIDWARSTKVVKRIELYVFTTNERAIHLYEKYGFVTEGEKQNALRMDGEYINEYIMALLI